MMQGVGESVALPNAGGPPGRYMGGEAMGQPNIKTWFNDFLIFSPIEYPDDFDKKMQRAHAHISQIFNSSKTSQQIHNDIINPQEDVTQMSLGLIVVLLKDPKQFQKYLQPILYYNNSKSISNNLQKLIAEKWSKLARSARETLLLLLKNLLSVQFHEIEFVFYTLFRSLSNDFAEVYYIEKIVDIFLDYPTCMEPAQNITLMSYALFRFLRFLLDHGMFPKDNNIRLRQKEQKFCLTLLNTRFSDFIFIGRDLIRLIYHVSLCPNSVEFQNFFKKLIMSPATLAPKLTSIIPMLRTRTIKDYIKLLIPFQVERKIKFMLTHIEFGQQNKPQAIFLRNHLSGPQQYNFRGDIIRYVCTTMKNEPQIPGKPQIFPRWAFIGFVLSTLNEQNQLCSYTKFALYYDFLCTESTDNPEVLMEMEPSLAVIAGSREYSEVATPAIAFLLKIQHTFNYAPQVFEFNRTCMKQSLRELDKKLFDNTLVKNVFHGLFYAHLAPDARQCLDEYMHTMMVPDNTVTQPPIVPAIVQQQPVEEVKIEPQTESGAFSDDEDDEYPSPKKKMKKSSSSSAISNGRNNVSDSEIIVPIQSNNKKVIPFDSVPSDPLPPQPSVITKFNNGNGALPRLNGADIVKTSANVAVNHSNTNDNTGESKPSTFITGKSTHSKEELQTFVTRLTNDSMKNAFNAFLANQNPTTRCKDMEKLAKVIIKEGFETDEFTPIVSLLLSIFEEDFERKIFRNNNSKSFEIDQLKESIKLPIYAFFQELTRERNSENRNRTLDVLQEIEKLNPKLRYYLLYFLSVSSMIAEAEDLKPKSQYTLKLYEDYIAKLDIDCSEALFDDFKCCIQDDCTAFFVMLPRIYKYLEDDLLTNGHRLIEIIIKFADDSQIFELINKIVRDELKIISEDELEDWFEILGPLDSSHQNLSWQIVRAHRFKSAKFIPLLEKCDVTSHNNILSYMLTMLVNETPTESLVNSILTLKGKSLPDDLFVSLFMFWCENYPEQISEAILSFVRSKKNKREPVHKLLKYFDKVIKILKKLKDDVLAALMFIVQQTQTLPKNDFKDLLSLINDDQLAANNKQTSAKQESNDEKKDSLRTKKLNTGSPKRIANKKRTAAGHAADETKAVKRKLDKDSD